MIRSGVVVAVALLAGCSDSETALRTLQGAGYKDINITGYTPFMCGKDDTFSTGFEATGPTGVRVTGAVCSGLLVKGATIRAR